MTRLAQQFGGQYKADQESRMPHFSRTLREIGEQPRSPTNGAGTVPSRTPPSRTILGKHSEDQRPAPLGVRVRAARFGLPPGPHFSQRTREMGHPSALRFSIQGFESARDCAAHVVWHPRCYRLGSSGGVILTGWCAIRGDEKILADSLLYSVRDFVSGGLCR